MNRLNQPATNPINQLNQPAQLTNPMPYPTAITTTKKLNIKKQNNKKKRIKN